MFQILRFFRLPWKNNVTTQYILERSGCKHKHVHLQLSYISGRRKVWYFPISRTALHMYGRSASLLKVSKHSKLIHQHCHFIPNVKTFDIRHLLFSLFFDLVFLFLIGKRIICCYIYILPEEVSWFKLLKI